MFGWPWSNFRNEISLSAILWAYTRVSMALIMVLQRDLNQISSSHSKFKRSGHILIYPNESLSLSALLTKESVSLNYLMATISPVDF
jgi:hypothetical protein